MGIILELLTLLPSAIKAGMDVYGLIEKGRQVEEYQSRGEEAPAELKTELKAGIDVLRARLHDTSRDVTVIDGEATDTLI